MSMRCSKCGAGLPDNAKFCPQCAAPAKALPSPQEKNKRRCLIAFFVIVVVGVIVGAVRANSDVPIGRSTLGEMFPTFILLGVYLFIIVVFVIMAIRASKNAKRQKRCEKELKAHGMSIHTAFKHIYGLPIAANMVCEIFSYPDRIEFKSGTINIILQRNKITNMYIKADTKIQERTVSSAGGAIAGAVMFGPMGAYIGGRPKIKRTKNKTQYLIITYTGEKGESKYINFDISADTFSAPKLVKEFYELNTNPGIQIEL